MKALPLLLLASGPGPVCHAPKGKEELEKRGGRNYDAQKNERKKEKEGRAVPVDYLLVMILYDL
jgi:hypothetical protein